ncbi:MAG TPA: hypothetical protein VEH76_01075 [Methylocystis sp.]|nr:hypothetical protein [Methylocystis sp.]
MTTPENVSVAREAVGVFGDSAAMDGAIDELLISGFDHSDLSLLAAAETVEGKLGHKYKKVEEVEDDPAAPRTYYVSQEAIEGVKAALVGGLVFLGAVGAIGAIVASGGTLAAAVTGAALGAGTWGVFGEVLAKLVGGEHADYIQEQLAHGGLLLWVRCSDPQLEKRAIEILTRHSGRDVHVHQLPLAA